MNRPDAFSIVKSLFLMPNSIRKEVVGYYLKKVFGSRPTDRETIWTSFLYFSAQHFVRVRKDGGAYVVDFEYEGKSLRTAIRGGVSSDVFVFFQVFIANGYKPLIEFLKTENLKTSVVVDAGANVGYFSVLILSLCETDMVVALEPEKSNYLMLRKNIDHSAKGPDCRLVPAAIWTHQQMLSIQTSTGHEWASKITEVDGVQACQAYSLKEIMELNNINEIDVLKLDIEGTEDVLFRNADFLKVLEKVKVLAIEIHDQFTERAMIHRILSGLDFKFFEQGELTVAWNNRLVHE